ncbi:UDP-N-acetylmuramate dehydrogenase [Ketobacter sp.]|uniref:UDP-N-acetylmuramate dehydrogenase n=1 Tax=Ketobacter sp. TaxID=2083498 RepID=UPI000F1ABAC8|nr:UDP-N-acetylmuramate dehydrogenase [Ketobacter sp.]RLU01450.1 MAG: UDP-N-acetylmuramate dehydrogenase [Ketobacter sp.]
MTASVQVQHQISLQPYNTLSINVRAARFCAVQNQAQLHQLLHDSAGEPLLVLGGGSNLVLTSDFSGLVIHNCIEGVTLLEETADGVVLEVGAGEHWDRLVATCVDRGWYGLENLSWIPGTVGAAPIQNIGAYGVELKDVLVQVTTLQRSDLSERVFTLEQCGFGYRDSVFKREQQDRQIILSVRLRLSKTAHPKLGYGEIRQRAEEWGYDCHLMTPAQLRQIIIRIRSEKLPDPAQQPNVGSFFKNPVVSQQQYEQLVASEPGLVAYPQTDGRVKLAAGWLIDRLGWKGRQWGQARVHDRQALVLINEGSASGDLMALAAEIQRSVRDRWGVNLEIEPRVL